MLLLTAAPDLTSNSVHSLLSLIALNIYVIILCYNDLLEQSLLILTSGVRPYSSQLSMSNLPTITKNVIVYITGSYLYKTYTKYIM